MTKTRCMHVHFRKILQRVKKTLRLSASDQQSQGVTEPLSLGDLPEECISLIISFTSPRDACVFALVSKTFESAVQSDIVWEKFIPPEYESLLSRSQHFSSKKELFFALCDESVLINVSKKDLWIEKATGKRCMMLSASALNLSTHHTWKWITNPVSAWLETVPELLTTRWFEIRCRTNTRFLSPRTRYSVYIVFLKADICYGFAYVAMEAVVRMVGHELSESCRRYVCFHEAMEWQFLTRKNLVNPERREDGWMEIEIGEFFNEGAFRNNDEIEMSVSETTQRNSKRGLIIRGIEIRPTKKPGNEMP
nr:hypothetical protein [Arabidopsis thaliana]